MAEQRQVERASAERAAEAQGARQEREQLLGSLREAENELAKLERRERELAEERDALAGTLGEARANAAAVQQLLVGAQESAAGRESAAEAATEALAEHRLAAQETSIHRESLREKVLEELEIDLEQGLPAELLGPAPEAGPEEGEAAGTGVDGASEAPRAQPVLAGGEPDWEAVEAEIEELRARMGRMGNVNLAAVDELREVEERLAFLTGQRDDLLAARASLLDTISKVNKESRERFVATFEEVREHFRTIFRKLFRGGKADIFLAEGEDVLEAGIEIVAAPPGKDARSISLLSGGERTLTAVGLLFALFRAKPSPVCMLDEVDAALDETNIDRFCTVLEDFLGGSQFLVVTHARRTMSYADTLYGITMQEHGVSRALSLSLREYDEHGAAGSQGTRAARVAQAAAAAASEVQATAGQ